MKENDRPMQILMADDDEDDRRAQGNQADADLDACYRRPTIAEGILDKRKR